MRLPKASYLNVTVFPSGHTSKHTIALPRIGIVTALPSKELIPHSSFKGRSRPAHGLQHKVAMAVIIIPLLLVLTQLSTTTIAPVRTVGTIIHVTHCIWVTPLTTSITIYSPWQRTESIIIVTDTPAVYCVKRLQKTKIVTPDNKYYVYPLPYISVFYKQLIPILTDTCKLFSCDSKSIYSLLALKRRLIDFQ